MEEQNRHLREQNAHCNDQMDLLKGRLELLQEARKNHSRSGSRSSSIIMEVGKGFLFMKIMWLILVPLIIRRVIRRIEDGTNTDIIPPVTYIMPYSYLPLDRRYKSLLLLKIWIVFKVFTAAFFICCPILLLGKKNLYIEKHKIIDMI